MRRRDGPCGALRLVVGSPRPMTGDAGLAADDSAGEDGAGDNNTEFRE
jgi:hypothetical protein